jgi:NACHT, LRR and PYD domains-containing protein 3
MVLEPLPLNRPHVLMNKFKDSGCADYQIVKGKILDFLGEIRKGTPLTQADAWIRTKHYNTDKLKIDRLLGDKLSIEDCYVNLAMTEQSNLTTDELVGENSSRQPSHFTLAARLKVYEPDKKIQVALSTLFDPRNGDEGDEESPRRILIHGRAGIGKTTLCKKMVHEFVHRSMWSQLFDRILWVPLRHLKRLQSRYCNLKGLFHQQYFSQHPNADSLAEALRCAISSEGHRTLFVLDGLDEASQELDPENHVNQFLHELLGQANFIITSRPHATLPSELDGIDSTNRYLRLETVGFYPEQVQQYIENAFTNPRQIDELQLFLQGHWLIQSLVRIPVLLDALCSIWGQGFQSESSLTMTKLYEEVELRLWQMHRYRQGNKTKKELTNSNHQYVEKEFHDDIRLLEVIAFTGLCNDIQEFTYEQRQIIYDTFELPVSESSVEELCFLRTPNTLSEHGQKEYHFQHLTFQEYFAARYIVRQWKDNKDLICLNLANGQKVGKGIAAADFVKRGKYNPGYDILLRFVAGRLHGTGDEDRLCEFFETLEAEPRDLLGPVHQRLVMHCLGETDPSERMTNFSRWRGDWENRLSQWLKIECRNKKRSQLASEMEFPERILEDALRNEPEDIKIRVLRSLKSRLQISPRFTDLAGSWLKGTESAELKAAALIVFQRPDTAFSVEVRDTLAKLLKDHSPDVRVATIEALGGQSNLSKEIREALVEQLKDRNPDVKVAAIKALVGPSNLSNEICEALKQLTKDKHSKVRAATAKALGEQRNLLYADLKDLMKRLESERSPVVKVALNEALDQRSALSQELSQDLMKTLIDSERSGQSSRSVRLDAVKIIAHQSNLPEELLETLSKQLDCHDPWIRKTAAEAFTRQYALQDKALHALIKQTKDSDFQARAVAIKVLSGKLALSKGILETLAEQLKDNEVLVKVNIVNALGRQPNLSTDLIEALLEQLKDKSQKVRAHAAKALGGQSDLSDKILTALVERVRADTNAPVRGTALSALVRQSTLSEQTIKGLMERFEEPKLRNNILRAFGKVPNLSDDVLRNLIKKTNDVNLSVKIIAIKALSRQLNPSNELLNALTERLKDGNRSVRFAVVDALDQFMSRRPKDFVSILLGLDNQSFRSYYDIWLERSFHEHRSWYSWDTRLHVDMPQGIEKSFACSSEEQGRLQEIVRAAQKSLDISS